MSDYVTEIKNLMGQANSLTTTTPVKIVACLTFTLVCAAIIYCIYRFFYRGACYSENFAVLLVMVAVITAMIILTISSSVALSLGTIGALSIIRFAFSRRSCCFNARFTLSFFQFAFRR